MLLCWNKPERIMTVEQWKNIMADSAPPGTYTPNMSEEDKARWKAKLVGHKVGRPHIEIRKTFRGATQLFLLVSLGGGYNYSHYKIDDKWNSTKGVNIHMSCNGALQMTFVEFDAMKQVINEAVHVLCEVRNQLATCCDDPNIYKVHDGTKCETCGDHIKIEQ
jgi:hypothetical protein